MKRLKVWFSGSNAMGGGKAAGLGFYGLLSGIFLLAFAFNYFSQSSDGTKYFNSDELMIHSFIRDVMVFDGRFSAWNFSNAPSFLPDYLIAFVASLLSADVYWQIFISSFIQLALLVWVIGKLAAHGLGRDHGLGVAAALGLFIALLASKDLSPYYQVLIINWHFGTYLIGLYCVLIYLAVIFKNKAAGAQDRLLRLIWPSLGLCLLAFGATLSDALFAIVFPGALFSAACVLLMTRRISLRMFALLFVLPLLASVAGRFAAPRIVPNFVNLSFQVSPPDQWLPRLQEALGLVTNLGLLGAYLVLFFVVCTGLAAAGVWRALKTRGTGQGSDANLFLQVFVLASLASNLLVVVLSNSQVGDRYLPALFFSPLVFCYVLAPRLFQTARWMQAASVVLLAAYLHPVWTHRDAPLKSRYYPEHIACIDNAVRTLKQPYGIGEYWLTKSLVAFSKQGVRMASVNPNLSPYKVLISNDWYREKYNFAVINTHEPADSMYLLDERLIEDYNGKADRVVMCGDKKVLLYPDGLGTTMDPVKGSGVYFYPGCKLMHSAGRSQVATASAPAQSAKGEVSGSASRPGFCSHKIENSAYSGNLTYGPYLLLPEGNYEYELQYVSRVHKEQAVGTMDISFLFPHRQTRMLDRVLTGTDGKVGQMNGRILIDASVAEGKLELRTFVNAHADLEVLSVQIARLKPLHP